MLQIIILTAVINLSFNYFIVLFDSHYFFLYISAVSFFFISSVFFLLYTSILFIVNSTCMSSPMKHEISNIFLKHFKFTLSDEKVTSQILFLPSSSSLTSATTFLFLSLPTLNIQTSERYLRNKTIILFFNSVFVMYWWVDAMYRWSRAYKPPSACHSYKPY